MAHRPFLALAVFALAVSGCELSLTPSTGSPVAPTASAGPSSSPFAPATGAPSASPTPQPTASVEPTPAPTPAPTPTPAATRSAGPRPTPTSVPSPTAAVVSAYIAAGSRTGNAVALTFDFGGRVSDAVAIVDYLRDQGIHATVFATGAQAALAAAETADGRAVRDVLAVVCRDPAGFAFGNHSYHHPDFATLTPAQMRAELLDTEKVEATYCGRSPRPYFRPPGGSLGGWQTAKFREIMATVGAVGYTKTIFWDVDTIDWSTATTKQQIIDRAAAARAGSIVLMHLGGYHALEALPTVLANLRAKGLRPVTLDELLGS